MQLLRLLEPNMQTARFEIGSKVKMTGGLAEHYHGMTAVVVAVTPHAQGLRHLCQYRVSISGFGEDTFYEFQLAAVTDQALLFQQGNAVDGRRFGQ